MSDDLSLAELARAADVTPRTVRYYLERGVLPAVEFKSRATRYPRELAVRIRAIGRLQRQGLRLDAIKRKLALMPAAEVEALAGVKAQASEAPRTSAESYVGPYRPALAHPSERWDHVTLCPGVVLMVRGEADAEAWRVARQVVAMFGGKA